MDHSVPILPTISTSFIFISAILVARGWYLISKGRIEAHKKTMLASGVAALTFFIIYMSRTIFIGNTSFGGPDKLKPFYTIFLIFHVNLATIGGILGLINIITGLKDKLKIHRKLGPVTSIVWFATAVTGLAVYLLLYVLYEGGETTSVIKAILGT
ncbi:DUF420 domain-containing protein [Neobacillus notoginsengisoli]|uniref:DUF420 domain-containing protein n=1 Tax=Neobacillus notoginsengisoli TaxID=1578198 RepID=A0A417YR20_9BACI|nr:DUF420 domain-containing protein [Neobacillus notoginsengisoli]RHW36534.1 DUF420 domain-containing protein [Neobacillus notoginsengisoli]